MTDGPAQRALRASLKALDATPRDGAAVALARRYAALMDAAAVPASYAAAFARLERVAVGVAEQNALTKVRAALSAQSAASDLGPKLLAVLVQLGLTPAARGVKAGAPLPDRDEPDAPKAPEGTADDLRARRARRAAAASTG